MTCPECGSTTSSVLPQCEKCRHQFLRPADSGTDPPSSGLSPATTEERWGDELTQRVRKFRRRRANLQGSSDPESTLEFDFEDVGVVETARPPDAVPVQAAPPRKEFDTVLKATEELRPDPALDSIPLRQGAEALPSNELVGGDLEADGLQAETRRRRLDAGSISIVMESSPAAEAESDPLYVSVAPLGRRFLAGVVDGLMLLLALALFIVVVWWVVGGRLHLRLADLVVLGFVAGFLVLSYFALFGRLATATPGQQAAGLALQSLDGGAPTSAQALWRAFGYLVSLSALMLGFVWALVDSDGLTWHDHMSRTFLARRDECGTGFGISGSARTGPVSGGQAGPAAESL